MFQTYHGYRIRQISVCLSLSFSFPSLFLSHTFYVSLSNSLLLLPLPLWNVFDWFQSGEGCRIRLSFWVSIALDKLLAVFLTLSLSISFNFSPSATLSLFSGMSSTGPSAERDVGLDCEFVSSNRPGQPACTQSPHWNPKLLWRVEHWGRSQTHTSILWFCLSLTLTCTHTNTLNPSLSLSLLPYSNRVSTRVIPTLILSMIGINCVFRLGFTTHLAS